VRGNNLLNTEAYILYIDIELTVVGCAFKCWWVLQFLPGRRGGGVSLLLGEASKPSHGQCNNQL